MWGADRKFRHEGNCSASRSLPSDAEQLPEWRNFQFAPKNYYGLFFLHTLPSTIAFRLEYVLFYQFYAKITTFFDQERFGTAALLYVDVETFWRKKTSTCQKWRQNVKIVILTSCKRVVLHPSCKTTFPSPGRVHGNPCRVRKNDLIANPEDRFSRDEAKLYAMSSIYLSHFQYVLHITSMEDTDGLCWGRGKPGQFSAMLPGNTWWNHRDLEADSQPFIHTGRLIHGFYLFLFFFFFGLLCDSNLRVCSKTLRQHRYPLSYPSTHYRWLFITTL